MLALPAPGQDSANERAGDVLTEAEEPTDDTDEPFGPFDPDGEDEGAATRHSWLGALGQMIAAVLVVVALVALFIGAAVAIRRLLP